MHLITVIRYLQSDSLEHALHHRINYLFMKTTLTLYLLEIMNCHCFTGSILMKTYHSIDFIDQLMVSHLLQHCYYFLYSSLQLPHSDSLSLQILGHLHLPHSHIQCSLTTLILHFDCHHLLVCTAQKLLYSATLHPLH
jgi:hypothetical protein